MDSRFWILDCGLKQRPERQKAKDKRQKAKDTSLSAGSACARRAKDSGSDLTPRQTPRHPDGQRVAAPTGTAVCRVATPGFSTTLLLSLVSPELARRVAPRRPPTNLHPERAGCHELRPVQLKGVNGSATARCQTENLRSVLIPAKVIGPLLTSRVPQPDTFPAGGIPYEDTRALEFIACMAGQPEIPLDGPTSLGFGNDMVDAQTKACDALGCLAIAAPTAGHPGYALAQVAWHASFAGHGQGPSGLGTRCPRYFSSRAA